MDEADAALADILADCTSDDDLQRYIMKHATIVQRLACCMAKNHDHAEARIRELYADLADLAVKHIGDSRILPARKLH
jgi:hypothetical protein